MKRIVVADIETRAVKIETALNRFFKKYPELDYWRETFEWMYENEEHFFCDDTFGDGTRNKNWTYALHLSVDVIEKNKKFFYIYVIERA